MARPPISTPLIYLKTGLGQATPAPRRRGYSARVIYLDNAASTRPAAEVLAAMADAAASPSPTRPRHTRPARRRLGRSKRPAASSRPLWTRPGTWFHERRDGGERARPARRGAGRTRTPLRRQRARAPGRSRGPRSARRRGRHADVVPPGPPVSSVPRRSPPPCGPTPPSSRSCSSTTSSARCSRSRRSPACSAPTPSPPTFSCRCRASLRAPARCGRARSAPIPSPSRRTSSTGRGAPARSGCARARASAAVGRRRPGTGASLRHRERPGLRRLRPGGRARAAALDAGVAEAVAALRDRLEARARGGPGARPTVTGAPRAPHIASLAFPGLPAEPLLHALEARGVLASAGSACASSTRGPSPSLKAIGVDDHTACCAFAVARDHARGCRRCVAALSGAAREVAAGPGVKTRCREGPARRPRGVAGG